MKDKLDGKIMKKIAGFKAKTYSYLIYNDSEDKTCVIKKLILKIMKTVQKQKLNPRIK